MATLDTSRIILVVSTLALATGCVVIIVLIVILYVYKRRQQRETSGGERVEEPEIVEGPSHNEASTHRGEPPPDYREATVSTEFKSITIDQSNPQLPVIVSGDSERTIENTSRQTINHTNSLPPPYTSNH